VGQSTNGNGYFHFLFSIAVGITGVARNRFLPILSARQRTAGRAATVPGSDRSVGPHCTTNKCDLSHLEWVIAPLGGDDVAGGNGTHRVRLPTDPFRHARCSRADSNMLNDDVMRADIYSSSDQCDSPGREQSVPLS
jgi:hypothetical protein